MLALNGVSISDWTGVELPFLPQFPMETWNFRIVHIAGATALGFLLFSAHVPPGPGSSRDADADASGRAPGDPGAGRGVTAIGFVPTRSIPANCPRWAG
jgi:hypothetical protein